MYTSKTNVAQYTTIASKLGSYRFCVRSAEPISAITEAMDMYTPKTNVARHTAFASKLSSHS